MIFLNFESLLSFVVSWVQLNTREKIFINIVISFTSSAANSKWWFRFIAVGIYSIVDFVFYQSQDILSSLIITPYTKPKSSHYPDSILSHIRTFKKMYLIVMSTFWNNLEFYPCHCAMTAHLKHHKSLCTYLPISGSIASNTPSVLLLRNDSKV